MSQIERLHSEITSIRRRQATRRQQIIDETDDRISRIEEMVDLIKQYLIGRPKLRVIK
jgi:hypothetical protein